MWGALIGAGISLFGGNRARKEARRAQAEQAEMQRRQLALGQQQLDDGRARYADWERRFNPIYDEASRLAFEERGPNYSAITADVNDAFGAAESQNNRRLSRYGISPGDGAADASARGFGLSRATALVDAANKERMNIGEQRFGRIGALSSMIAPIAASGDNMMSGGYGMMGGALGGAADSAGSRAASASASAGAAFGAAGQFLGMAFAPKQSPAVQAPAHTSFGGFGPIRNMAPWTGGGPKIPNYANHDWGSSLRQIIPCWR
jgi:hypothetical protein